MFCTLSVIEKVPCLHKQAFSSVSQLHPCLLDGKSHITLSQCLTSENTMTARFPKGNSLQHSKYTNMGRQGSLVVRALD
jgi:hypothetical protein